MSVPGQYDIRFVRGDRLYKRFGIEAGTPPAAMDLTGTTSRIQVRSDSGEGAALVIDLTPYLTLVGNESYTLDVPGVVTAGLSAVQRVYSWVVIDALANPRTYLEGRFVVEERVTVQQD